MAFVFSILQGPWRDARLGEGVQPALLAAVRGQGRLPAGLVLRPAELHCPAARRARGADHSNLHSFAFSLFFPSFTLSLRGYFLWLPISLSVSVSGCLCRLVFLVTDLHTHFYFSLIQIFDTARAFRFEQTASVPVFGATGTAYLSGGYIADLAEEYTDALLQIQVRRGQPPRTSVRSQVVTGEALCARNSNGFFSPKVVKL